MSVNSVKDKIAAITGGANGIGFEIASKYLQQGLKTALILDFDEVKGNEAVTALTTKYGTNKAVFFKCDVTTDIETVSEKVIKSFNTVDILVNCAGICNERAWQKCLDINLTALVAWTYKFIEHMRKDRGGKGGTIVNLASIYGFIIAPYLPVYHASKFGVMGFTRSIGHQQNFEKTGVRVVAICPGVTSTKLIPGIVAWDPEDNEAVKKYMTEELPQQTVNAVGDAAIDVFKVAESGSAWCVQANEKAERVNVEV